MNCQGASAEMGTGCSLCISAQVTRLLLLIHSSSHALPFLKKKALFVAARFIIDNQMNPVKKHSSPPKSISSIADAFVSKFTQNPARKPKNSLKKVLNSAIFRKMTTSLSSYSELPIEPKKTRAPKKKKWASQRYLALRPLSLPMKRLLPIRRGSFFCSTDIIRSLAILGS
jgi:hypothetical protein